MKKVFIIVVLIIIAVAIFFVWQRGGITAATSMEKVSFLVDQETTTNGDNWIKIVGNYWEGSEDKAVILLHMMPSTKESWNDFAELLNKDGYHVLAIDLRGHGESTEYKIDDIGELQVLDYTKMQDKATQDSINDVEGAHFFLQKKGITANNIVVGGASIGGNLALQHGANHPEIVKMFALSPGLDYRGVVTVPPLEQLRSTQNVFLVAAQDDPESATAVEVLGKIGASGVQTRIFETGGHGTTLFETNPVFAEELRTWLTK